MKQNSFDREVIELCRLMLDHIPTDEKCHVFNLVRSPDDQRGIFQLKSDVSLPACFWYFHDQLPNYLMKVGVVIDIAYGTWFAKLDVVNFKGEVGQGEYPNDDLWLEQYPEWTIKHLTLTATQQGLINPGLNNVETFEQLLEVKNKDITLFKNSVGNQLYEMGPVGYDNCVVLVNVERMNNLVKVNSGEFPIFDDKSGVLSFLGESVSFNGEKTTAAVKLLVSNVNSRVTHEDFYMCGGDDNYNYYKKSKNLTQLHDTLSKRFKSIKKKISSNEVLRMALVMTSTDGYGMFVDQSAPTKILKNK